MPPYERVLEEQPLGGGGDRLEEGILNIDYVVARLLTAISRKP